LVKAVVEFGRESVFLSLPMPSLSHLPRKECQYSILIVGVVILTETANSLRIDVMNRWIWLGKLRPYTPLDEDPRKRIRIRTVAFS